MNAFIWSRPSTRLAVLAAAASLVAAAAPVLAAPQGETPAAAMAGATAQVPAPAPVVVKSLRLVASLAPDASLAPARTAEAQRLDELAAWNRSSAVPKKEGFARPLATPLLARMGGAPLPAAAKLSGRSLQTAEGSALWTAGVKVEEAYALRLHLTGIDLPPGSRVRVWGRDATSAREFDPAAVVSGGEIWAPVVFGDEAHVEVEVPAGALPAGGVSFAVPDVLEIFRIDPSGRAVLSESAAPSPQGTECLVSGECYSTADFPGITAARGAIAHLKYVKSAQAYVCTGGLVNDTKSDFIPYLLTANHCFGTQTEANTLQTFFDYRYLSCGSTMYPALSGLPGTYGATLLASSSSSDYTFLQLSSTPSGSRYFLGWDSRTSSVANGTNLYRISHPLGMPQYYNTTRITSPTGTCSGWPSSSFLYENLVLGATAGGSSGSPVLLSSGAIVGQLSGACGSDPSNECLATNYEVDGGFFQTYSAVKQWLAPSSGGTCTADGTTLCLYNSRFKVQATYKDYSGNTGSANAVSLTTDSGYFWFFSSTNVELVAKIVSFCSGSSGNYGIYASGLTDVQVTFVVTDVTTGLQKTYTNPLGNRFCTIADGPFSCP